MRSVQIPLTVTLPEDVVGLLRTKAGRLGVSMAQLVKKLIMSEVKQEKYPTFKASKATIRATKKAMKDYEAGKAVFASDFFRQLNNES